MAVMPSRVQHEKVIAQQRKALDRLLKERGGDSDRDKENAGPAALDEEERLRPLRAGA